MKTTTLLSVLLALGMCIASCSGDDEGPVPEQPQPPQPQPERPAETPKEEQIPEYPITEAAWDKYLVLAANHLEEDANKLYNKWNISYAKEFKTIDEETGYKPMHENVKKILQGCLDVCNDLLSNKQMSSGESVCARMWLTDYQNNVRSIANALIGKLIPDGTDITAELINTAAEHSIIGITRASSSKMAVASSDDAWNGVVQAWTAIGSMNLLDKESGRMQEGCKLLSTALSYMLQYEPSIFNDQQCAAIAAQYVDNVVMPTLTSLKRACSDLAISAGELNSHPSDITYSAAATRWQEAHKQWELSEAFRFGPAAELGSAASMDSKISKKDIDTTIRRRQYEQIDSKASLRGFHAVEHMLYLDGGIRVIK